ncbi:MAG: CHAP domain-containing protein [Bdellovibrionales bacterium]|nr:CHAP domain-containing protein [Bdellovibrionales bacterium]
MKKFIIIIYLNLLLFSFDNTYANDWDAYNTKQKQQRILFSAQKQYSKKHLQLSRLSFRNDCSGYINLVLWDNGHSLEDFYQAYEYQTNGVSLIYKYIERVGWIYNHQKPKKGDFIFFSNTYDANRDGKINDLLTHIGIIESIDKNDTITFLHYMHNRVRRGYMNLSKPNTYVENSDIVNTYLRRKSKYTSKTLSAQLFDGFGRLEPGT